MSRYRTLANLRADVRKYADLGPDTTTGRHTNDDVNKAINRSWRAMRELASDNGHHLFLVSDVKAAGTMVVGPVSGSSFGSVAVPEDCEKVFGVDVFITTTDIRRLVPASFQQRNDGAMQNGQPWGFFTYNIGNSAGSGFSGVTTTQGAIGLVPAPDKSYAYTIWYLPLWADVTTDTDPFDDAGMGGCDWVTWDCVARFAAADGDMGATYAIAAQERQKAEERLSKAVGSVQRAGPARRVDIEGRNHDVRRLSADPWRR